MTPLQQRVLEDMRELLAAGFSPTYREIARRLKIGVGAAYEAVSALVDLGHVERAAGKTRGLRLAGRPDLRAVPTDDLTAELARRGVTPGALSVRPEHYGRGRPCAADTCGALVQRGHLFCRNHWFKLPRDLQDGIKQAFGRRDEREYERLVTRARDLVDGGELRWRA